jgi:hypothetical protein
MSMETEQDTSKCSSLSPPLAKASADDLNISAEAFLTVLRDDPEFIFSLLTLLQ